VLSLFVRCKHFIGIIVFSLSQLCCPWLWSLVVLKDKISAIGPVLGLEGL